MSEFQTCRLDDLMAHGLVQLGRGDVISKDDIAGHPGPYPIYSSSAHNNGKFGEYGKYMFDEELITWSVDGGGNFFYRDKHQFSVTNVCGFMRVNEKQLHHKFVYYSLAHQHRSLTFDYTDKAHPSVIKKQYRIPSIGKPVQEKIASILTSIDTAIEKTEALIAKHQQIKAGLMHDLFTRGVLPNGQLRPPRSEAPELYQETAMGWIPKDWDDVSLGQIASFQRGHDIVETDFKEGMFPVVSSSGIIGHHSVATTKAPNVVIGRKGTIGKVHFLEKDFWAHDTSLFTTDFFNNDPRFVFHLCIRLELARFGTKSGSPSLNRNDIHPVRVGRPMKEEQITIAKLLDIATKNLDAERRKIVALRYQKLGLMQDLLTGKVPVKVDGQTSATADQAIEQKVLARLGERAQAMEVDIDAI